jgi:ligand-binding SRPBCC domain-containing protein
MSQRFVAEQWLPYPVEHVFAFFANPANLPRLMPTGLDTRIEKLQIEELQIEPASAQNELSPTPSATAGAGSRILISFRPVSWLPLRVRWLARITEFAWNNPSGQGHFCDEQVRGPFASFRHCHRIEAETHDSREGTRVIDAIEFTLPLGWLGRIGEGAVRRQLAASFAFRQQRLEELLQAECGNCK